MTDQEKKDNTVEVGSIVECIGRPGFGIGDVQLAWRNIEIGGQYQVKSLSILYDPKNIKQTQSFISLIGVDTNDDKLSAYYFRRVKDPEEQSQKTEDNINNDNILII